MTGSLSTSWQSEFRYGQNLHTSQQGQAHTIQYARTRAILLWPQLARPSAWNQSATGIIVLIIHIRLSRKDPLFSTAQPKILCTAMQIVQFISSQHAYYCTQLWYKIRCKEFLWSSLYILKTLPELIYWEVMGNTITTVKCKMFNSCPWQLQILK